MDITITTIVAYLESQLLRIGEQLAVLKLQEKRVQRLIEKASSGQINEAEVLSALFAGDSSMVSVAQPTKRKRLIAVTKEVSGETTGSQETADDNSEAVNKPKKERDCKASKVVGFIAEHPGTTSEEIFAWCLEQGIYENNSADQACLSVLIAGQKSKKKLFSKPEPGKKWHRYYANEAAMPAVVEVSQPSACRAVIMSDSEVDGASAVSTKVAAETEPIVAQQEECITTETQSPQPIAQTALPIEEEPLNPPCPKTYMPGTLNGDVFKFIWDNEGVTIDEIRQHIAVSTWGKSAAGNVHKNVEAMKSHRHIFRGKQNRAGATVVVYKAMSKDVAVSKMQRERQEARAREHAAAANKDQDSSGDKTSVDGPRTKKPHSPPQKLKTPSAQDDWSPAVIWLIKRLRGRCSVVDFETLCQRSKTDLVDFGLNLSTVSSTVIENAIRRTLMSLRETGRLVIDSDGVIMMCDSDDDEVVEDLEDEPNEDGADMAILLADDDGEVPSTEEIPFIPPASSSRRLGLAIEEPRQQITLWRGKSQLNRAVQEMQKVIKELMADRDDFDNGNDIANAFFDEGTRSWEHNPQISFRKLEALVRLTIRLMIARKEINRDWDDFLVLADRDLERQ